MSDGYDLQTAKQVEKSKLNLLFSEHGAERERRQRDSEQDLAHRGLSTSPIAVSRSIGIRVELMEELIVAAIEIRRDLIRIAPGLASEYELEQFRNQLDHHVDVMDAAIRSSMSRDPRGGGNASLLAELPSKVGQLKSKIRLRIDVLRHESRLPKQPAVGTIKITTGHGSIVNVGDVSNSIQSTLSNIGGNDQLKDRLTELTKAIEESSELALEAKTSTLENLEFIARQVAAAPSHRQRASVIETVWNGLGPILSVAANLAQLYSVVGPVLMKWLESYQIPLR